MSNTADSGSGAVQSVDRALTILTPARRAGGDGRHRDLPGPGRAQVDGVPPGRDPRAARHRQPDRGPRQVPARRRGAPAGRRDAGAPRPGPGEPAGHHRTGRRGRGDGQHRRAVRPRGALPRPGRRAVGAADAHVGRPARAAARDVQRQGAAGLRGHGTDPRCTTPCRASPTTRSARSTSSTSSWIWCGRRDMRRRRRARAGLDRGGRADLRHRRPRRGLGQRVRAELPAAGRPAAARGRAGPRRRHRHLAPARLARGRDSRH